MPGKLNIAFLWHMHQPYYRDPKTGKYALPWVRLHALKGYTDMLEAVRCFGEPKVTFNLVPCLVKQICDLASGEERDVYFDLSEKPASDLDPADRQVLLQHFFSANPENMIIPYSRYRELYLRRSRRASRSYLDTKVQSFSNQDYLDLQVWFNLTWFGWAAEERHPVIGELKRKGRDFSEDDKIRLLYLQIDILKDVIPAYKSAWEEDLIDVSTTPYYHPILPLLIDNSVAGISQPQDPMPKCEFSQPDDAHEQLRSGREYMGHVFGRKSIGLWPSEGSVSPEVCQMAGDVGFEWLATDERILQATLPGESREVILYRGYKTSDAGPAIIFRDQYLSDAIGFRYSNNPPVTAVDDFIGHLENIAEAQSKPETKVVPIILDGENAWEYFKDGGYGFCKELYTRVAKHPRLRMVTFSQYLLENPPQKVLPPIFAASWIDGSFRIWIGDAVKNRAWDRLAETDAILQDYSDKSGSGDTLKKAKEYLHIAEGSDWFWWYGEPNQSEYKSEFDYLFRSNLMQVYRILGLEIPDTLQNPIGPAFQAEDSKVFFTINPTIDGRETSFYEWIGAREILAIDYSGSMNLTNRFIDRLYYGISKTCLFLRLDPTEKIHNEKDLRVIIQFNGEDNSLIEITGLDSHTPEIIQRNGRSTIEESELSFDRILEMRIPFKEQISERDELEFSVMLLQKKLEIERWPREGWYACPWPTSDYLIKNWVL